MKKHLVFLILLFMSITVLVFLKNNRYIGQPEHQTPKEKLSEGKSQGISNKSTDASLTPQDQTENKTVATDDSAAKADFVRYQTLASKALLRGEEREDIMRLYHDPTLRSFVLKQLQATTEQQFSSLSESVRMQSVTFLSDAYEQTDDDNKQSVVNQMEQIIVDQSFKQKTDERVAKSLLGDRIEMLLFLRVHELARYNALKNELLGSEPPDRAYSYALSTVENRFKSHFQKDVETKK